MFHDLLRVFDFDKPRMITTSEMPLKRLLSICACSFALAGVSIAHGGGNAHQKPIVVAADADWATRHMAEEHHIANFDPGAFFSMHDFDNSGTLDMDEILTTYGLKDESTKDVPEARKAEVVEHVLKLIDKDGSGDISRDEWMTFSNANGKLPDFGLGPGHHGDDEYEYEIHHWEKYHDENTKEEDLIHPEDIAHFKKHDEMEEEQEKLDRMDQLPIVEENIPQRFRRT